MPFRIGVNIGFVTNSSSMVFHFPRQLLDHPKVKQFIEAFELQDGFVGSDLWSRDTCTTIAMTREQKRKARENLASEGSDFCRAPAIDTEDDSVVVIYGDEYESVANTLAHLMQDAAQELKILVSGDEYN